MPVLFNDYDFGKARQEEIRREAESARLVKMAKTIQPSKPGIRERLLIKSGNILIAAGWKIRNAGSCPYACSELSRV
jgi:hypothetical protein